MDLLDQATVTEKDLPSVRSIPLDNNKINITRTDPYGFCYISLDRGQLPEWLRGAYTSFIEAERAAHRWIAEKNRTVKAT